MSYSNIVKKKVRTKYNLPLIKQFCRDYNKKCRYFGLTGKDFSDILDWNSYIQDILTVEYNKSLVPELIKNIHAYKLDSKTRLVNSDVIKLICSNDPRIDYPFDIINFDFLGTFIYQFNNKNKEKRIERIEVFNKIIKKQGAFLKAGRGFLFFITINGHRGRDISIFENALKSLIRKNNRKEIEWLLSLDNSVRQYQKIAYVLPALIFKKCLNLFDVKKFKIIVYQANQNIMVHLCYYLIKNIKAHIDFSDIDSKMLTESDIILIKKDGKENLIKGTQFFSTENPFNNF